MIHPWQIAMRFCPESCKKPDYLEKWNLEVCPRLHFSCHGAVVVSVISAGLMKRVSCLWRAAWNPVFGLGPTGRSWIHLRGQARLDRPPGHGSSAIHRVKNEPALKMGDAFHRMAGQDVPLGPSGPFCPFCPLCPFSPRGIPVALALWRRSAGPEIFRERGRFCR